MYLKQINAYGFKSFADKLDINLDNRITCIVGPNGSGKSNVVDAVRWVLGEQSVKQLRGDGSISDVIFSGSKSRNPLNVATVELVFDNNDHYLNVPYTDISIKRKVFRTGENEYFLNGDRCRLKDIINLLMDSGIGKESYNIISQGEVDKIISNSSMDRRVIIEDAAGIVKYKKRKEEALKKLDKTHNNLDRVNDIILELETQVEPLKEQSEKAQEYLDNKESLKQLEVALLAFDIYNDSEEVKRLKEVLEKLEDKLSLENVSSNNDDIEIEKLNKLLFDKEKILKEYNAKLLEIVEECEKINTKKRILEEKAKNTDIEANKTLLLEKLDKKAELDSLISVLENEINETKNSLSKKNEELISSSNILDTTKNRKRLSVLDYSKLEQEIISTSHKINSLNLELDNGSTIPLQVKKVLSNTNLFGIYNTIGNVISIDSKYTKALEVASLSNRNFIITENEAASKNAINYLKDNRLGRATFFPLSVIKPRYIDSNSLNILENDSNYLGILSNLLDYDSKYSNIIENQFGTVVIATNLDGANILARKTNHKYKIVTLDGDVVNVGGSMTGGSLNKASRSNITIRQELEVLESKKVSLDEDKVSLSNLIDKISHEIEDIEESHFELDREKVSIEQKLNEQNKNLSSKYEEREIIKQDIESLNDVVLDSVDSKVQELIKLYYDTVATRDTVKNKISTLTEEIKDIKDKLENLSNEYKVKNSTIRTLEKEKNDLNIKISKLELGLDNYLNTLSVEYSLTYEKAREEYELEVDREFAKEQVNKYKSNIRALGMVNLAAIEEYERVSTRYEFLCKQRDDLSNAETSLLDIMREMDGVIKEEFFNTFKRVNEEFGKVFKELFSGGYAELKLTNPDDILTTGVDIVASPPGKKLSSITLLSGGEKTLTAISLLFAILNVREVPFCLFDEVEAALDEANVIQFGKYLSHYKDKTQFLIITHKKKTMEYADTLYGITMQESGVSKLVSVKLNDHIDTL
ncbi:MAG: AAA family ATPase [Bacilli bacterium]|nr:AAA family ATPase [Bacilli bacterium]